MKEIMEASVAAAEAVRLCKPKVVPIYPITPQTHIVETIAKYAADGKIDAKVIDVESEHSAMAAAIGAQATGVRTFTATCSQGLMLMAEMLPIAAGLRLPIVMAVANRAISSPLNIWCDHSDSMFVRDSSWIQLFVESAQEIHDTIIQAYKIAEKVNLPVMVCLDGYSLSHLMEPVDPLTQKQVDSFLPNYKPLIELDPLKPITIGAVAAPNSYMEFKQQQQEAMNEAIKVIKQTNKEFKEVAERSYGDGIIECYNINKADYAIVAMGSVCGTAKHFIDNSEEKYGLIKIRSFRPFPTEELKKVAENLKGLAVIDRSVSYGHRGPLFTEVTSALKDSKIKISGFIAGLGGRDIKQEHLEKALRATRTDEDKEVWLN